MTQATQGAIVAKLQKSLMLTPDLVRLVEAHQRRTGASFTRVLTAALLQYLFQDPEGPDPLWMQHAVSIELGEYSVGDMPTRRIDDAECSEELDDEEIDPEICELIGRWERITERKGDEPIQKIIKHWSDRPRPPQENYPASTDE